MASLVGAFVGAAIAGIPLAAIVIVAGLIDINHARRKFEKEKPLPTEQEQPAIDVEAHEVEPKTLPDAVEVEPETVSEVCDRTSPSLLIVATK